jgi:hypothetical protein
MALISLLLSFLAKKVGTLLQAIFGWSVVALFGRLPARKQMAVTVALVVSLAWPLFVAGLAFPPIAGWALAFLPLEKWASSGMLRAVWGVLAALAPLLVGGLVRFAAPSRKGGVLRSLVNGYPMALGFFLAFLVTALTMPLVKLATIARGWTDEHLYVQPRNGEYRAALRDVAEACARSGLMPTIEAAPRRLTFATRVIQLFARGALTAMVTDELQRVRADDLELYLYPADLLVRGKPSSVARFRATLPRTHLAKDAYLTEEPRGQDIQDQLGRLEEVLIARQALGREVSGTLGRRLVEVWREMSRAELSYTSWITLEGIARRLERKIKSAQDPVGMSAFPLDDADDGLPEVAKEANAASRPPLLTVARQR